LKFDLTLCASFREESEFTSLH